jgi:hypothetical protein
MCWHVELFDRRMASSGMLRRVALLRIYVSEELSASIIRVVFLLTVRRLLVIASVVPRSPILVARRNILEDAILHSHRRENLKSYILVIVF